MAAVAHGRFEQAASAAILLMAMAVAAWVLHDRTPDPKPAVVTHPKPVVPPQPTETEADQPKPFPGSMTLELVELPPELPPEPQGTASSPPPAPEPQVKADVAEPPPPVAPAPAPIVEVLRPQPEPPPPQTKPVIPLRPEPRTAAPEIVPLHVTNVVPKAEPPPPTPLKPKPPKPVEKTPVATPVKTAALQPPKPPKAVPKADPPPVQNVAALVGEGRAFLRILERGSGPSIEIRWPTDPQQRDRLYGVLVQCLGMRTVILDNDGRLYIGEGARGQPTTLNSDRYSGFVRRPEGAIATDEQREIARVRAYHATIANADPARIFPRRVDAFLIGGLSQAVGEDYLKKKTIRAAYRLSNGHAIVDSITVDGSRIDGSIDLSTVATACGGT